MGPAVIGEVNGQGRPLRLAVFRALNLGDMLCSMPAFRALRISFPTAYIALIGLPSSAALAERHRDCIDELIVFPGHPALPEQPAQPRAYPRFVHELYIRRIDVILQMHGSGLHTNAIVRGLPAAAWAGFVPCESMAEPGRLMPWPDDLPEAERHLALLRWLGMRVDVPPRPTFTLLPSDIAEARQIMRLNGLDPRRLVIVHPGARLPSRRWPPDRFAAVATALADDGWQVAVTGDASERSIVDGLCELTGSRIIDLCGRTTLGGLAALLRQCRLLICNDTGVSHVAAAVEAASVVIASGSDVHRWAPGDAARHAVLHWDVPCRPCMRAVCPYAHPCARGVSVEAVLARAGLALQGVAHERAGSE